MRKEVGADLAMEDMVAEAAHGLKVCPLCDALNARGNVDCFVCGWHGRFTRNREAIEEGLIIMMARFPELADGFAPRKPVTWQDRLSRWWQRVSSRG